MSEKCQGKTEFSPGQGILKKCQGIWPFDSYQGIVREFCHIMSGNCWGFLLSHFLKIETSII